MDGELSRIHVESAVAAGVEGSHYDGVLARMEQSRGDGVIAPVVDEVALANLSAVDRRGVDVVHLSEGDGRITGGQRSRHVDLALVPADAVEPVEPHLLEADRAVNFAPSYAVRVRRVPVLDRADVVGLEPGGEILADGAAVIACDHIQSAIEVAKGT